MKSILIVILAFFGLCFSVSAQTRVAVIPFNNMDGRMDFNEWCFKLQDSVAKSLQILNSENKYYIVPVDSVEMMLSELNLDPSNPQYQTDMWKAINKLNVKKVVSGYFIINGSRFLINAFTYNVKYQLPYPNHQAKNIYCPKENPFEAVKEIVDDLLPGI